MTSSSLLVMLMLALAGPASAPVAGAPTPATRTVRVEGGGSYTDVGVAGLAAMLKQKSFPLVNVHVPYAGEIPGTDLFIPFDRVEADPDKLPADKRARIVLYCRSGSMGAIAARALVRLGYTDVWNLDGGMIAWQQAGYPLARRAR